MHYLNMTPDQTTTSAVEIVSIIAKKAREYQEAARAFYKECSS